MKLSIRLSKPNKTIGELLKEPATLTGPRIWGTIEGAQLYYGTSYNGEPSWVSFLSAGSRRRLTNLNNQGALALLFIPIDSRYMLFSFGYGNHKLFGIGWEKDFGLKVVLNSIDPNKVKSLDAKTVDTVVMTRRVQLSKENPINDFGFEIDRDLLKSIAGKAANEEFGKMLSGGENLTIHCDITADNLNDKVEEIYNQYNSTDYQTHYSWIDNVVVENDLTVINALNADVLHRVNLLLGGDEADLDTASPDIIDFDTIAYFKVRGYNDRSKIDFIDIDTIVESLQNADVIELDENDFMKCRIESFDGNDIRQTSWPIYFWLVCETQYHGNTYILSEGEWYQISSNYLAEVDQRFNRIVAPRTNQYRTLQPTIHTNERDYLANYIATADEFIFDSDLSYIYGGNNSVEICDIYTSFKEFIHIKDGGSSSKLSHLFNQGYVSANIFLSDVDYRNDITGKLRANHRAALSRTISRNPKAYQYTIVYRILKKGARLRLPFFTKLVLVDMYRRIKTMGYQFRLEWVPKR